MNGQPVTLEGRHQRGDLGIDAGDDGDDGDRQKGQGGDKDANNLLLVFEFKDEVDQDNRPGEEDQRFVHIRKRNITIPCPMGFQPAKYQSHGVNDQTCH